MVGQVDLKERIHNEIINDTFPRFCIIAGPRGSGKKLMCQYIVGELKTVGYEVGIKVDDIRAMIDDAYRVSEPIVYLIKDADNMSITARNALLKVVEEPPKNAYFIMTLQDLSNTLSTIRSRARTYTLQPYTPSELGKYSVDNYNSAFKGTLGFVEKLCTTPGEVDLLHTYDVENFVDYVGLVIDNIAECEPANSFKSASKLAIKTVEGYDLELFWRIFIQICADRIHSDYKRYADGISITSMYLRQVNRLGVNKQQLYDMWVFDIRSAWI